jgi:hypothetical protein
MILYLLLTIYEVISDIAIAKTTNDYHTGTRLSNDRVALAFFIVSVIILLVWYAVTFIYGFYTLFTALLATEVVYLIYVFKH